MVKIKTIMIIILGLAVLVLTIGLWDPFQIRKPKADPTPDFEKEREKEKAKTNEKIHKDLVDLGTNTVGVDRDTALQDLLDKDYPGTK